MEKFGKTIDKPWKACYNKDTKGREKKGRNIMKRETYENNLNYIFNPTRANAKYSLDGGQHWMNHGDYCECLAKSVLGFEPHKDANTKHTEGHDIPELNASVKSWNCGLTDRKELRGLGFDKFCETFFNDELEGTIYIWVHDYGEMVDLYYLDMNEMKEFTKNCAKYYDYEAKVRFKMSPNKIIKYLDERVA